MVTNFRPRTSQSVVKTNIFLTRHAFHTLYVVLGDARRRKINSCLRVLFTAHAHFLEKGFKHYIQHFVLISVGWSRPFLHYFACVCCCVLGGASLYREFWSRQFFEQKLSTFKKLLAPGNGAEPGRSEPHRTKPSRRRSHRPPSAIRPSRGEPRRRPTLTLTISLKPNILGKIISRKHDIDISILSDIMLIFNIGNIDIDIDIYFTIYLRWGRSPA